MSSVKDAVRQARKLYQDEAFKDAEAALKAASADEDRPYLYWVLLGACQAKLGKAKDAEKSYTQAVQVDDAPATAWQGLRDIHLQSSNHKAAVEALGKVADRVQDDNRLQALVKIAEVTAKYDNAKLTTATYQDYSTKEANARASEGRDLLAVPLLGGVPADIVLQRHDASASVARSLVYSVHPSTDAALLEVMGASEVPTEPAVVDWALQRAASNLATEQGEAWGERLAMLLQRELRRVVDAGSSDVSYHILRSALAAIDEPSPLEDVLVKACHLLCPDDPATGAPSGARRNKTPEEIYFEKRQRVAGAVIAAGRIAAVSQHPRAELCDVYHAHSVGEWVHLEDVADLEAPLLWLRTAAKECPEVLAVHALRAATLLRLGRQQDAVAAAELGLSALAFRVRLGGLPAGTAAKWGTRLASVIALGCVTGLLSVKAKQVTTLATQHCPHSPHARIVRSEVLLAVGASQAALEATSGSDTGTGKTHIAGRLVTAKAHLALRQHDAALADVEAALQAAGYSEDQATPSREVPHLLAAKAEVLCKAGDLQEALRIAEQAIEMSPFLSRPHCVKGHFYYAQQRRIDTDGCPYTRGEFVSCYDGTKQWVRAGHTERRIDPADGKAYSRPQFESEYGLRCPQWEAAVPAPPLPTDADTTAIAAYSRCVELDPLDVEGAKNLCSLYSVFVRPHDLLHALERVTAAAEARGSDAVRTHLWAFHLRGFLCLKHTRYDEATTCLKHCVRYENTPVVAHGLARAYEGLGNYPRALGLYKSITARESPPPSVLLAARHGVAACLLKEGQAAEAERLLLEVTSEDPESEASWLLLARSRWQLAEGGGKAGEEAVSLVDKACAAAEEAIRCSRDAPGAYRLKGDVCLGGAAVAHDARDRFLVAALDAFQETVSRSTTPAERAFAHYDVARAQFAKFAHTQDESSRAAAEAACRDAIKLLPRCAIFWTLLGCSIPRTLPNRRLWCINKALQLDPRSFESWCAQGWLLLLHNQVGSAKTSFEKAQLLVPGSSEAWLGKGLCLLRLAYGSMTYDARSCFEQAYQARPTKETALLSLIAQTFYQPRRYGDLSDSLLSRAEFVRKAYPKDPTALNTAGLVLEELGALQDAFHAFTSAGRCLGREDNSSVLEWVSGRNGVVVVREHEAGEWSLVDAYNMFRMVLTSRLRVLCKRGEGGSAAAADIAREITELVSQEDMPYFESTSRVLACHLLNSRAEAKAEKVLHAYLECESTEAVSRDAVLAGISLFRSRRLDDTAAATYLPDFRPDAIANASIRRAAELAEAVGSFRRHPQEEADLTLAQSAREKLLMFKVLLEGGEGPPRVRYHDPGDGALIEFRQDREGRVFYTVSGEARPPFRQAEMGADEEGSYIEMPDIDTCVPLPQGEALTEMLPRLRRLLSLSGVRHNLEGGQHTRPPVPKNTRNTQLAAAQLLALVRSVLSSRARASHRQIEDTVEVLYRFALVVSSLPGILSESTQDIARILTRAVAMLKRVTEEASTRSSIMLFKARYALGLLLYSAPALFNGAEQPWEDVLQPEDTVASDTTAASSSEEGAQLPALQWCIAVVEEIAAEGYAEAATLLGLAYYALGNYKKAVAVLRKTLDVGHENRLDWSRWDAYQGVLHSMALDGDFDAASDMLKAAEPLIDARKIEEAAAFVRLRQALVGGRVAEAYTMAESSASLACLIHATSLGVGGERSKPLQRQLLLALPQGSLVQKNYAASLKVLEAWEQLKKDPEGLPVMEARLSASASPVALAEQAWNQWEGSVSGRVLCILCGILSQNPSLSSEAIDSLRKDVPGIDSSPLLHYWLSAVRDGVSVWESIHTLLREVGIAGHDPAHLWFALRKVVEALLRDWVQLCPQVRAPDPTKLKGKEYREAVSKIDDQKRSRVESVAKVKRIGTACLDRLKTLRPESPYIAQKRAALDALS